MQCKNFFPLLTYETFKTSGCYGNVDKKCHFFCINKSVWITSITISTFINLIPDYVEKSI